MKFFLPAVFFTALYFIIPALNAAVLVCLVDIFGESVLIYILVSGVFMLVFFCIMYFFFKDRIHREENTDAVDGQDNDW